MKKLIQVLMIALIGVFAAAMLAGCDDDDDNGEAALRVLHMSYDAPAVDVLLDDAIAVPTLAYPDSSGYADISSGTRNVKVVPAGSTTPVVIDADLDFDSDKSYTVLAVNQLNMIEAIVAQDTRDADSDKAMVRFVHASPDAPAVDIRVGSGSGPAVFENAAFKDITDYAAVEGGDYVFAVTAAGSETEVARYNPVTLENGQVYTVVAHGTLDDLDETDFAVRAFVDTGSGAAFVDLADANIMAVNASPDAPAVDLLVEGMAAGEGLEFPQNTGYLPILSGSRNIKINVAGTSTTVIEADLSFETGGSHTSVFAIDEVAAIRPLVFTDDLTEAAAGKAHVRFVHLSPDAPNVDVALAGSTVLFGNVAFGEADNGGIFTPLPAGTYDLEVRVAGTDTVVLPLPGITLEEGRIYTVFAKGFAAPAAGEPELGAEIIVNK
jgi:hypothetical protein